VTQCQSVHRSIYSAKNGLCKLADECMRMPSHDVCICMHPASMDEIVG